MLLLDDKQINNTRTYHLTMKASQQAASIKLKRIDAPRSLSLQWPAEAAQNEVELYLGHIRPESSTHHPKVRVRLSAHTTGIRALFRIEDRYMLARDQGFQAMVCRDSCVEMFVQPPSGIGYINFECNALGNLHCSHIKDPNIVKGGFANYRMLTQDEANQVSILSSINDTIDPVDPEPRTWTLALEVPWGLFKKIYGETDLLGTWRINFYKCADESTHPHWLSWSPVRELNFHAPDQFGYLHIID